MSRRPGTFPFSLRSSVFPLSFVRHCAFRSSLFLLSFACATTVHSQQTASFTVIPGASGAFGISGDGSVVTGWLAGTNGGFRWTEAGGVQPIGAPAGGTISFPRDISDDGNVIVGNAIVTDVGNVAFKYQNGAFTILPPLATPEGGESSFAMSVSRDGAVAAGYSFSAQFVTEASLWSGGGVQGLGLGVGGDHSAAYGISPDGSVIVGTYRLDQPSPNQISVAFRSVDGAPVQSLGTAGYLESQALGASENGEVIVGGLTATYLGPITAAQWTEAGGWDPLEGTVGSSLAYDVSADGTVIVGLMGLKAFIWTKATGARDLNDLLANVYGLDLGGMTLTQAHAVSDSGYYVAGRGMIGNEAYAWVARVPLDGIFEPAAEDIWIAGTTDTIRWNLPLMDTVNILYSVDYENGSGTFDPIVTDYPADSGKYAWKVPESLLSRKCAIMIFDRDEPTNQAMSGVFRIKPWVLTVNTPDGNYDAYDPDTNAWGFRNSGSHVWPSSWWSQFNYRGVDPFTGLPYSQIQGWGTFQFTPDSIHPDWPSFVNTFSPSACYVSQLLGVYSPTALSWWDAINKNWEGSCFGMAISNAMVYRNRGEFAARYPGFPGYSYPRALGPSAGVIAPVIELFTRQYANPHKAIRESVGLLKTPTQTVNELKAMLSGEDAPVRTLSILNNGAGGGGHAILAWGLRQDTTFPNLHYVRVYDNSWLDSTNAQIVVDTAANGGNGSWTYSLWPGWGGGKWIYLRDPAVDYLGAASLPKAGDGGRIAQPFALPPDRLEVYPKGAGTVILEDSLGNVSGFVEDSVRSGIPGSCPVTVENGSIGAPQGYGLGMGWLEITLAGLSDGVPAGVRFFTGNRSLLARRANVRTGEEDRYTFDGGLTAINGDTTAKPMEFHVVFNDTVRERTFGIRNAVLGQGDSVRLDLADPSRLKIMSGRATAGSYEVEVMLYADTGVGRFLAANVPIGAGVFSHTLEPDWSDPAGSDLRILVDSAGDGSIEDTLTLSNTLTGVEDEFTRGVPAAFTLDQNYPNPFNPSTEIRYALPVRGRVSLIIYDLLGREVATLVDREQEAGYHSVRWDASGAPAGIYVCRLVAGGSSDSKKMVILK